MRTRRLGRAVGGVVLLVLAACAQVSDTPWPSLSAPILASETFSDRAGDVSSADLVGVHVVATAEVVIVELEFASPDDRAKANAFIVLGEPLEGRPVCNAYIGPHVVGVRADASAALLDANAEEIADLEAAVNGPWMSVAVPLSLIGDPPALYFAVTAIPWEGVAEGVAEYSPDAQGACHTASLGP